MNQTNKNQMTEIEQLAASITENTKGTLRDILSNPDKKNLKEEMKIKFEEAEKEPD